MAAQHICYDEVNGWAVSTVDIEAIGGLGPDMTQAIGYRYETMLKNDSLGISWDFQTRTLSEDEARVTHLRMTELIKAGWTPGHEDEP